jgi:VanZ family protein
MLPSFYASSTRARAWNVARAACLGAAIGALAALFKTFGPLRGTSAIAAPVLEIAGAALAFALLCAGVALLRNIIARKLIWRQ